MMFSKVVEMEGMEHTFDEDEAAFIHSTPSLHHYF